VYYTKVTEYQADMGISTGKTVYEYYPDNHVANKWFYPLSESSMMPGTNVPYLKTDWYMGALKSVSEYRFLNGKYTLMHRKDHEYTTHEETEQPRVVYVFPKTMYQTVALANGGQGTVPGFPGIPPEFYEGHPCHFYEFDYQQYALSIGKLLPETEKEIWVENGDTIRKNTQYYYDNSNYIQPTRIVTSDTYNTYTRSLKYTYDYTNDNVLTAMKNSNIIRPVIEETMVNTTKSKEVSKYRNYYKANGSSYVRDKIESSVQGSALTPEVIFKNYDQYGNILMLTERDSLDKSYIWGYSSKYPVAEIVGKGYNDPALLLDSSIINNPTTETAMNTELKKLYTLTGSTLVNTYTHKPFAGISIHSTPQQTELRYEYDSFNRLNTIKDPDNQVVKQFDYHYGEYSIYVSYPYFTTIVPRMESYYGTIDGNINIINTVLSGGYNTNQITDLPIPYLPNTTTISLGSFPPSSLSKIEFTTYAFLKEMSFNFVQDGSIVATHTIKSTDVNTPQAIYLLPGKYTVVIKAGASAYNEYSLIHCSINSDTDSSVLISNLQTGEELQFLNGNTYTIQINVPTSN
jgi:YD repeat-containing protein